MNERRMFMKYAAALPAAAIAIATAEASQLNASNFCGGWVTMHTSPVGPFRELLVFAEGGGLTETNTLLHTNSHLSLFAEFGLPLPPDVNASDGMGTWTRVGPGRIGVTFRKLLYDGTGAHLGDFPGPGQVAPRRPDARRGVGPDLDRGPVRRDIRARHRDERRHTDLAFTARFAALDSSCASFTPIYRGSRPGFGESARQGRRMTAQRQPNERGRCARGPGPRRHCAPEGLEKRQ